jgi:hypothetical protein
MQKVNKRIDWEKVFLVSSALAVATVIAASLRTTFQPWYLLLTLTLASFVSKKTYIFIPSVIVSITTLCVYFVYVLTTDYAKGYPEVISNIELIGFSLSVVSPVVYLFIRKFNIIK